MGILMNQGETEEIMPKNIEKQQITPGIELCDYRSCIKVLQYHVEQICILDPDYTPKSATFVPVLTVYQKKKGGYVGVSGIWLPFLG